MHRSRSMLAASTLSALAFLAAACGDDTEGSGGGGGSSSGGVGTACEKAADFSVDTASELGCNPVDRGEFVGECEAAYGGAPQCAADLSTFVDCLIALPAGSWSCDPSNGELGPADDACPSEAQALVACIQG